MGIDSVAIKTFNSTGSQSVCRANDIDDTKLIESEFLTKCKTEYINGSGMSFIAGTLSALPAASANVETYHLPSDVDAISEIILQMRFKATLSADNTLSPTLLLDLINKIEMKVGNITFQTIFPGDIYARNLTENGNLMKVEHTGVGSDALPNAQSIVSSAIVTNKQLLTGGSFFDFSVSIPFTGRNDDLRGCFLQAGAVTNSIIMKVTYNVAPQTTEGTFESVIGATATGVSTGICVFTHQITNVEKNFLQENIVNRVVKASHGLQFTPLTDSGSSGSSFTEDSKLTIDLSPININVSHILLNLHKGVYGTSINLPLSTATGTPSLIANDVNDGSCWQARNGSANVNAEQVGVLKGWLKSVELVLGNDRTGNIPVSCITTNRIEQFGLTSVDNKNIYLIKLAGSAFSTAGVPFARLNNKKLILTFNALTVNPIKRDRTGGGGDETNTSINKVTTVLNVTCCGTQVQTTVGGSISFSA